MRMKHRSFHPYSRLPNELKLEILRYEERFASCSPTELSDLLFAFSDRTFRPSVHDVAMIHLYREINYFPFSLYLETEKSWSSNRDGEWNKSCHKAFGCPAPPCTLHTWSIKRRNCLIRGAAYRWYHYVRTHTDWLRYFIDMIRPVYKASDDHIYSLLLQLWPYLLTENSVSRV
jgi:hypothetical protein